MALLWVAGLRFSIRRSKLAAMTTHPQLVLSGMQPTNTLHLGNYLGALKNWVRMQSEMPCLFCVVDMHALTQESGYAKADDVRRATREVTAAYIAAGVDPKRTPLFAIAREQQDAMAVPDQSWQQMRADKAAAAEHDQLLGFQCH